MTGRAGEGVPGRWVREVRAEGVKVIGDGVKAVKDEWVKE